MIDIHNKTYQTRDGRPVRLYADDAGGAFSIHGAIWDETFGWVIACWTTNGTPNGNENKGRLDLVEAPKQEVAWIAMFKNNKTGRTTVTFIGDPKITWASDMGDVVAKKKVVLTEGEYPL